MTCTFVYTSKLLYIYMLIPKSLIYSNINIYYATDVGLYILHI